jgi:hypothetical protein
MSDIATVGETLKEYRVYEWKKENIPVVFADSMTNNRTGEGDRRGGRTVPWNYAKWKVTIFPYREKKHEERRKEGSHKPNRDMGGLFSSAPSCYSSFLSSNLDIPLIFLNGRHCI